MHSSYSFLIPALGVGLGCQTAEGEEGDDGELHLRRGGGGGGGGGLGILLQVEEGKRRLFSGEFPSVK